MAYSQEEKESIFKEVFKRIANGEALREVLKDKHLPGTETFYKWIEEDSDKAKQYAHATTERANSIFEDILEISDNGTNDTFTVEGEERTDHEVIQRSKLRVDTRKWMLSKMNPKKYGDRIEIETKEGQLSDQERAKRIKELTDKANELNG